MRPTELSIGDWVKVKNHDYPPMQVLGIVPKSGTLYFYLKPDLMVELDMLEPIPLTEEILARNFGHDGVYYGQIFKGTGVSIIEGELPNSWSVRVGGSFKSFWAFHVYYVHQLQHALRLAGVDKTIEL